MYEWGADFHLLYGDIWTLRMRAPEHVVFVALSASVEPGKKKYKRCFNRSVSVMAHTISISAIASTTTWTTSYATPMTAGPALQHGHP
jgi:hypothetical protein